MQQSGLGLSPPPQMQQNTMPTVPQSYYQASQTYGMSAIPSPPAVLFNSSQAGLYNPFQIEASRSQFSQYPGHYGAGGNAPAFANYMQQPPNMQTAQGHADNVMYQNLASQFRAMGGVQASPYNQSQQMNNPSTVLISSSSNALMSASVKPSSQQIGAIGSKTGQPYGAQQYMNLYPQQAPPLQSSNYFSNSAGGQAGAFFGQPTAGNTQSYGIQAATGMFSGHGTPTPTNAPPPGPPQPTGFGSQYAMNTQMLAAATTMNPQQYRGSNAGGNAGNAQSGYLKSGQPPNQSHMQDSVSGTSFFK